MPHACVRYAQCAVFLSCAMVLSYIESLFPPSDSAAGDKAGACQCRGAYAAAVPPCGLCFGRIAGARGFERAALGNLSGFAMSFCRGGVLLCSILYIKAGRGIRRAGYIGWRRGGANTAQVAVCAVITGSAAVFTICRHCCLRQFPTGLITGFTAWGIQKRVRAGGRAAKEDTEKTGVH